MSSLESDHGALRILTEHVRRQYAQTRFPEAWRNLPEIPTIKELVQDKDHNKSRYDNEVWNAYQQDPVYDPTLPQNIIDGPWPSTMDYLGAHYRILREDAIAPLRTSVHQFRDNPHMNDSRETYIYDNVSGLYTLDDTN